MAVRFFSKVKPSAVTQRPELWLRFVGNHLNSETSSGAAAVLGRKGRDFPLKQKLLSSHGRELLKV